MFTYIENPVTVEYAQTTIFLPYTQIQPATLISLFHYDYTPVKMEGKFGYSRYFRQRWHEGKTFINAEHDIVPYPGAIKALWDCPETWCAYDHAESNWSTQEVDLHSVPLGCTKITEKMMKLLVGCWDEAVEWQRCDTHLFKFAQSRGLSPHQHFPAITNANPALLERRKI